MESTRPKLNKNLLIAVIQYLDYSEIFKSGIHSINRNIYYDPYIKEYLFAKMIMQKLGIIEDSYFEI